MKTRPVRQSSQERPVLITGGAGFIGCNLANELAMKGRRVLIFDSMARSGCEHHVRWLKSRHEDRIEIVVADIRDESAVTSAVARADAVLHLAAQVAVTTSVERPREDFAINAGGTLNVLEAIRLHNPDAPLILASTNKVYGRLLEEDGFFRAGKRYVPQNPRFAHGVGATAQLDFFSPYGCSKGAADQYVRDYARVYNLRAVVLRMSCIFGPRQFGNEDQGWIAHFLLQSMRGQPITIFGDGLQVRDALHVSDAVAAWIAILDNIDALSGRTFNLGGGPSNTISLLELIDLIEQQRGERPPVRFDGWRPGDQPWYVSDIRAISAATGWYPKADLVCGLRSLERWFDDFSPAPRKNQRQVA